MAGLKKAGVELEAAGAAGFYADIDKANTSVTNFGRDAERAGGGVSKFGEIATGALRQVGVIAVEVGLQAAKAVGAFVADSIGVAADYEASLNRFSSVAGDAVAAAGMEIADFSDLALEMGAKTQFSAGEAADAMVELAKGGLDPATIAAGGLEGALNLAAAGELDLAEAANITAKQLGVWGDQGVTAAQVADRLAQAANASTVDVDELAMGMANVGGVAKIAGVTFDETTQTLALLAPGFGSAADASTSMKTFLSRLIPTTKDATGAMIDLGLANEEGQSAFYDSTGSFIGMEAAAELLQQQTKDLSEEERLLAFQTIFGADAIRAAAMVAEAGGAGFRAMGEDMNAAGTATEQAAKRNQGFAFAMESLKGSIETVQIVLGTMLLPLLTSFVTDYITPAVNGVLAFATAFGEAENKGAFLSTALTNLGTTIGTWIVTQGPLWAEKIAGWVESFIGWIGPMIPPMLAQLGNFAAGIATWIVEQAPAWIETLAAWGQSFINWVSPYVPILITKLGEFATAAWAWITEQAPTLLEKFKGWGNALVDWIAPMIPVLLEKVGELVPGLEPITSWLQETLPGAIDTAKGVIDTIKKAFTDWYTEVGGLGGILTTIQDTLADVGEAIGAVTNFVKDNTAVQAVLVGIVSAITAAYVLSTAASIAHGIATKATTLVTALMTGAQAALNVVMSANPVGLVIIALAGLVAGLVYAYKNSESFRLKVDELWANFLRGIQVIKDWAAGVKERFDTVVADFKRGWELITTNTSAAWETIKTAVSTKITDVVAFFTALPGRITGALGRLGSLLVQAGKDVIQGLIDGALSMVGAIGSALSGIVTGAIDSAKAAIGIKSPSKKTRDEIGRPMIDGIMVGMLDGTARLKAVASGIVKDVVDLIAPIASMPLGNAKQKQSAESVEAHLRKVLASLQDTAKGMKIPAEQVEAHLRKVLNMVDAAGKGTKIPAENVEAHLRKILESLRGAADTIRLIEPTVMTPLVRAIERDSTAILAAIRHMASAIERDEPGIAAAMATMADAAGGHAAAMRSRVEAELAAMVAAAVAAAAELAGISFTGGYAGGKTPWDTGDTGGTYTNFKPQLGALPMIRPPARPGEMVAMNSTTTAYGPTYNWSPTYNNANRVPEQDYYMQRALSA